MHVQSSQTEENNNCCELSPSTYALSVVGLFIGTYRVRVKYFLSKMSSLKILIQEFLLLLVQELVVCSLTKSTKNKCLTIMNTFVAEEVPELL